MRRILHLACAALASSAAAQARLTDASARAFVARQDVAWNAHDIPAFAATFSPDARFVDQARNSNGGVTMNGSSTLAQATAQARRFFAHTGFRETSTIDAVTVAPDGRSARVTGHQVAHIQTPGKPARTLCAETRQTLILVNGRLLSQGQTDTAIRCPH